MSQLVKLSHRNSESYVDKRLLDMGYQDSSYNNDETGSVAKTVCGREIYVYCPDHSRKEFTDYFILIDNDDVFASDDVEKIITFLASIQFTLTVRKMLGGKKHV